MRNYLRWRKQRVDIVDLEAGFEFTRLRSAGILVLRPSEVMSGAALRLGEGADVEVSGALRLDDKADTKVLGALPPLDEGADVEVSVRLSSDRRTAVTSVMTFCQSLSALSIPHHVNDNMRSRKPLAPTLAR